MSTVILNDEETQASTLKGSLGPTGIAMMVVATAAPLTVMAGVSPLIISFGNGAAAPTDALLVGLVMLLFSVGFVEMSKYISNAGAFYAYIIKGMGRNAGVGAASLAIFSYAVILIGLEAYIGYVISDALQNLLKITVPWWGCTLSIVVLVGFLGYRNIEVSTKILGVALLLEIAIILLLDFFVFNSPGSAGLETTSFSIDTFLSGSPGLGILFAVFGFMGFESTIVYREEAINPKRSIPLATYMSVIFISVLYFISFYALVIAEGADQVVKVATENAGSMYLDLIRNRLGDSFHTLGQVLLITSLFAVVLSLHNIVARYKYILGGCGVLAAPLGRVHEQHASPYIASAILSVASLLLLGVAAIIKMDPVAQIYTWSAAAGTLGYMVILALASLSVILFFASKSYKAGMWKTLVAPLVSFICIMVFLYLALTNLPALTGIAGFDVVNVIIVLLIVAAFLVGSVGALYMKVTAPRRYQALLDAM